MNMEIDNIRLRYTRRKQINEADLYSPLNPAIYMSHQEKERAFIRWIKDSGLAPIQDKRVLEVGCGLGGNLLEFLRLGFQPENLLGIELLEESAARTAHLLPSATRVLVGDAAEIHLEDNHFDVVLQSTVFTSILDEIFQQKLADRMWSLVKQGGGVLWYDFIFDNPKNPDVKGVPIKKIRRLFPEAEIKIWPLTLIPPINRRVTKLHPVLYHVFNLPLLRSHVLCWIKKV